MHIQETDIGLSSELQAVYFELVSTIRECFGTIPGAVMESEHKIAVRDPIPGHGHRPLLMVFVEGQDDHREEDEQASSGRGAIAIQVGIDGSACPCLAEPPDTKRFLLHEDGEIVAMCGAKGKLQVVGGGHGFQPAIYEWAMSAWDYLNDERAVLDPSADRNAFDQYCRAMGRFLALTSPGFPKLNVLVEFPVHAPESSLLH